MCMKWKQDVNFLLNYIITLSFFYIIFHYRKVGGNENLSFLSAENDFFFGKFFEY